MLRFAVFYHLYNLFALLDAGVPVFGATLEAGLVVLVALLLAGGGGVVALLSAPVGGDNGSGESENGEEFHDSKNFNYNSDLILATTYL